MKTLNATLENLRVNGVRIGGRWVIKEEGTGVYDALIVRDTWTSKTDRDSRYAMFPGKYRDL